MNSDNVQDEARGASGVSAPAELCRLADTQNRFRFVQWDITSRCNLRCRHCRSESFYGESELEKDLGLEDVRRRLDALHAGGVRRIHFLGGEPFSRRDLPEIVEYASKLGILCSINTNGTLITEAVAERIITAGTYLLTFSIDGPDAPTNDAIRGLGTFSRICRGIENVQRAKRRLHGRTRLICCFVLMRPNAARAHEMPRRCSDLGLQNCILTNLRRMGAANRAYDELAIPSEDERLDIAERVALEITTNRPKCNVQIDFVSLLAKLYLNARFGLKLACGRGGCDAVATKGYIQPDGAMFPCQDMAKAVGKTVDRERIRREGTRSLQSDRFLRIAREVLDGTIYRSYRPCNSCPALGRLCTPCPLGGIEGRTVVQSACIEAHRRAQRHGVDVSAALEAAAGGAARDRMLQDPRFRRAAFTTADPEAMFGDSCTAVAERERLTAFCEETIGDFQALLRDGLSRLTSLRQEGGPDADVEAP